MSGSKATNATGCRKFRVTGRVQGVFFRASTREVAVSLNLTGFAINLPDGSVEVLACGPVAALDKLAGWLQSGPPMALVSGVETTVVDLPTPKSFVTA